ncbi:endolytic transglycosylase MltG [Acidithiobacillus sp.]|uniref:endolytic transglycosylase MltG n=1 Tax=Acidithiobacillus sp. TaxID=1872118 RepID=UPI002326AD00|nr:endolytic transglycosylase MltG [Acidithiobacillus sp.]MDA8245890.1 endolytic transglycosylase MltG [Acidithiobacillus sp.]
MSRKRRAAGLFLLMMLFPFGFYGISMYWPEALPAKGVTIPIPLGATNAQAIASLARSGVLPHPRLFHLAWALAGYPPMQAGLYEFQGRINQAQVLQRLIAGQSTPLSLLIVPGWRLHDIYQEIHDKAPYLDQQNLPQGAAAARYLARQGVGAQGSAEGWLFPDSYRYVPGTTALSVLRRAYVRMQRELHSLWAGRAPGLPLGDPYQALILASIVQKEGAPPAEQAHIAAVFLNRLRQGMPLQSDPTVIYALGERYTGSLTTSEMHVESPYNTYLHTGLPPTPIAMPGLGSLMAVLHPADSADLYFIAQGDEYHYSESYTQHLKQIQHYLQHAGGAGL